MSSLDIKLPFNDRKHIPTRPEIDLLLGMLPAIELKRLEHQLDLMLLDFNWSMQWYEKHGGWGYRASYLSKVFVIIHFYKGYFTAAVPIPASAINTYCQLPGLTEEFVREFDRVKDSPGAVWVTFRAWKEEHVRALLSILRKKIGDTKVRGKKSGKQ